LWLILIDGLKIVLQGIEKTMGRKIIKERSIKKRETIRITKKRQV